MDLLVLPLGGEEDGEEVGRDGLTRLILGKRRCRNEQMEPRETDRVRNIARERTRHRERKRVRRR